MDWGIVETVALVPLLLLQLSVVVFLLARGRKDKSYRQAFYAFFIAVTVADFVSVFVVGARAMSFPNTSLEAVLGIS